MPRLVDRKSCSVVRPGSVNPRAGLAVLSATRPRIGSIPPNRTSMSNPLIEARSLVELSDIEAQAQRAHQIIGKVRNAMLAPQASKLSPVFTAARLASVVGLNIKQVDYRARKVDGEVPPGRMGQNNRREFNLEEARAWAKHFRTGQLRPAGAEAITIAVANFKGGVAKTTTALTIAQGLSIRGHDVLVLDCDPQGSLTTLFGILPDAEVDEDQTVLPLCVGDAETIDYAIRPTYWAGIDLVPATSVLFSAEFALPARQRDEGQGFQFWNVLNHGLETARQAYDVIVIDTPPALSYLTINAMMAADGILMPLPPNALDFASSAQFWSLFNDLTKELAVRGQKKRYEFVDVLLSKVDSSDAASRVVREWISAAYGSMVLPIEIPKTATAASASAEFGSVYDMRPGSASNRTIKRALDAYDQLVDTIESQLGVAWMRQIATSKEAA
jgi:chromosome partitioning protein